VNFNALFFNQMYFLDKEAKIEQFSKLMNVSKDEVNNFVQNEYGLDFDDLLNRNRVDYFIKLVKEPKYQNMTIDALAKESGFVSRNSFYKPFKKFHGGNPSDLIDFNS
jgi:YesN/AraC family two-component response regulator